MRENEEREGARVSSERGKGATEGHKFEGKGHLLESSRHGGRRLDKVTTSFLVTNFPDDVSNTDLWKLFINFEIVGEVFIPKKLDKWGRRFAFVKFWEVHQVVELEENLKDVWCGDWKLKVNRARFEREEKEALERTHSRRKWVDHKKVELGTTFRGALLGDERHGKDSDRSSEVLAMDILPKQELLDELERCFVGRLVCHVD